MKSNHETICVIPARRGSKRLKMKNIRKIRGIPLIAYSIRAALATKLFDRVYVATEDAEIARIAKKYGATVPVLVPKRLCGDLAPSWAPCVYLVDYLKERDSRAYKNLLCLQPTSVLKTSQDIINGMREFTKGGHDFLVSVTPIDPHFFHWAMREDNGRWGMYFGKKYLKDRHLLPPVYRPNGVIKMAKIEKLRQEKSFFGRNLGVIMMPEERSLHVITKSDLAIAEALMKESHE